MTTPKTRTTRATRDDSPWSRRRAGLVGVLLVAGALVGCTEQPPEEPAAAPNSAPVIVPGKPGEEASTIPPGEATPVEQEPPNEADVTFIQNMIIHHAQAVDMVELVPDRAAREEVKGLAARIGDSQQPEIDMMNRWLERNDRPTIDPDAPDHGGHGGHGGGHGGDHAAMPGMATPEQLAALEAARGERFDTLFLQMMMTHHEGALTMVEEHRTAGVEVRAQEIADDVAVTQTDEIYRMRGMLGS